MATVHAYQKNAWRETLEVQFFRLNEVAVPDRITTFNPVSGGSPQPTLTKDFFRDPNIAKPGVTPDPDIYAWLFGKYNVS